MTRTTRPSSRISTTSSGALRGQADELGGPDRRGGDRSRPARCPVDARPGREHVVEQARRCPQGARPRRDRAVGARVTSRPAKP
jgi:hypothetical protein